MSCTVRTSDLINCIERAYALTISALCFRPAVTRASHYRGARYV